VPDACPHYRPLALDLHASPAAVAALATLELVIQRVHIEAQAGRDAVDGDDETLAVRLTGRQEANHVRRHFIAGHSTGAGAPLAGLEPGAAYKTLNVCKSSEGQLSALIFRVIMTRKPAGSRGDERGVFE
jgi:hypothetical protein